MMNKQFKSRFLLHLANKNNNQGFTLIELLVVIIIIGILAAVALPNFIKQAGKAREVEFKNTVGTVNRSQQAYHWEKQAFAQEATDDATLEKLGVKFDSHYIDSYNILAFPDHATIAPANNEIDADQTRAYSGGIYFNAGTYNTIICQTFAVAVSASPPTGVSTCDTDAESIK